MGHTGNSFRRSAALFMAAAVASGLALRGARAETMADHVPADALLYAEWAGTDAAGDGYKGSNLEGILTVLDVRGRIEKALGQAADAADDPDKKAGIALIRGWTESAVRAPGFVYVGPIDFTGETPMPKIAFMSKVGASRAQEMAGMAQAAIAKEQKEGAPPVAVVASGDYVVLSVGKDVNADKWLATAPANPLSAAPKYKTATAQSKVTGVPVFSFYIDGEAAVQALVDGTAKIPDPDAAKYAPVIIDALGLPALRGISSSGSFDGKNWQSRGFVGLEGERKGLVAFFDFPPLTAETYAQVPAGAPFATVGRFDGARLLGDIRSAVVKIDPQAGQQFDMAMRQVYAVTGVDIEKDLLASLGDTFVLYATPEADGTFQRMTLVNKLKDPAKAEQALTGLESFASQLIAQRGGANSPVTLAQEPLDAPNDKVIAHLITTPVGVGAWTIKDGVLYVSGGKAGVEKAINVKGKGIADDPKFTALKTKLGQNDIGGFSYADVSAIGPGYYNAITTTIKQAVERGGMQMADLPPFDQLKPYMGTGMAAWWTDAAGLHASESGPFPGWSAINPFTEIEMRMQRIITGEEPPVTPETPATPPAGAAPAQ